MIKGKLYKVEFTEEDGEIECADYDLKKKLEKLYEVSSANKGPEYGFPEGLFLDELKKWGKDFELIDYKEPEESPFAIF